jgi:small subunit ribosomal protein S15
MSILKEKKQEIIGKFQKDKKDTGSTEIQIAILTERITNLTEHLKIHRKDEHCKRGLMIMVGQRKRLLKYLSRTNLAAYDELTKQLKIRSTVKEHVQDN